MTSHRALRSPHAGAATLGTLLALIAPAHAETQPSDPIFFWGIQRGCQTDQALSDAVADRLSLLGTPLHPVASTTDTATKTCLGPECAELLVAACGPARAGRGVVIGGHVDEQRAGGRYLAKVRLFRVDLGIAPARSYYRYEQVNLPCTSETCAPSLADLVATLAGQLQEERSPTAGSVQDVHSARPSYCSSRSDLPPFLCSPFNLQSRCGDEGREPTAAGLRCPIEGVGAAPPPPRACDCKRPQSCGAAERAACPVPGPRDTLRKAIGGAAIAAGGGLVLTGLLLTLNFYNDLTLNPGPVRYYATQGEQAAAWTIGAGLIVGGALVLADPLRLFAAKKSPVLQAPQPLERLTPETPSAFAQGGQR